MTNLSSLICRLVIRFRAFNQLLALEIHESLFKIPNVPLAGFEPAARGLGNRCSIHTELQGRLFKTTKYI